MAAGLSPVPRSQRRQGRGPGARQALGAGQSTVPQKGSALSKALQSPGPAPRAPRDRDTLEPHQGSSLGDVLGPPCPWQGQWHRHCQHPGAKPFSSGVTQPLAALVGWGEAAHQHRHTDTALHLAVPVKGPGNVPVLLPGNLQCPAGTGACQGSWGVLMAGGAEPLPSPPCLPQAPLGSGQQPWHPAGLSAPEINTAQGHCNCVLQ